LVPINYVEIKVVLDCVDRLANFIFQHTKCTLVEQHSIALYRMPNMAVCHTGPILLLEIRYSNFFCVTKHDKTIKYNDSVCEYRSNFKNTLVISSYGMHVNTQTLEYFKCSLSDNILLCNVLVEWRRR